MRLIQTAGTSTCQAEAETHRKTGKALAIPRPPFLNSSHGGKSDSIEAPPSRLLSGVACDIEEVLRRTSDNRPEM
jgi:hypothetical protein